MENKIKQFGWKRNLTYILASLKIGLKSVTEYKINLYMAILNHSTFIFIQIIFLATLNAKFNDFIGWTFMEYVFFIIFYNLLFRLFGTFYFHSILRFELLNGKINSYLTKPINIFMQHILTTIPIQAAILSSIYFMSLIIYIIYYSNYINYMKLFLLMPFGFLAGTFNFIFVRFLDSFAFFIKSNKFLMELSYNISNIYTFFPANMFQNNLKYISFFVATAYQGTYSTLFLFNKITLEYFIILNFLLITLIFIFSIGTYLLWHYGLKKYEAFS